MSINQNENVSAQLTFQCWDTHLAGLLTEACYIIISVLSSSCFLFYFIFLSVIGTSVDVRQIFCFLYTVKEDLGIFGHEVT